MPLRTPGDAQQLRDEVRCLRGLVDQLVAESDVSWVDVLERVRRYKSPLGRSSWRLTYLMALQAAAAASEKPRHVLSELPIEEW